MSLDKLQILRDKCLFFNQFMIEEGLVPAEMVPFYKRSNSIIEEAFLSANLKPLSSMSSDIDNQILMHMPAEMALKLKKRYRDHFGVNIVSDAYGKIIKRIINRGRILSNAEYELTLNRIDEIFENPSMAEEVRILNNLLTNYHANI